MKFRYSVVRYMPSLIRGEALNIGVLIESEGGQVAGKFLGALSRIRTVFPDADLDTLRLVREQFKEEFVSPGGQLHLFGARDTPSLDALVRAHQGAVSLSGPRVTLGADINEELEDLFAQLVAPRPGIVPKPISATVVAPGQLRGRVDHWFTKRELIRPGAYQRNIEVPGTFWTFDFGVRNGKTTLVQTISLKATLDVAMSRAALVAAKVRDAREAGDNGDGSEVVEAIAVHDLATNDYAAAEYLEKHSVIPVALRNKEELRSLVERPLHTAEPVSITIA